MYTNMDLFKSSYIYTFYKRNIANIEDHDTILSHSLKLVTSFFRDVWDDARRRESRRKISRRFSRLRSFSPSSSLSRLDTARLLRSSVNLVRGSCSKQVWPSLNAESPCQPAVKEEENRKRWGRFSRWWPVDAVDRPPRQDRNICDFGRERRLVYFNGPEREREETRAWVLERDGKKREREGDKDRLFCARSLFRGGEREREIEGEGDDRRRRRRDNLFADPCSTVSVCENYFSSYSFSFALSRFFLFSSFFFLLRFDNPLDSVIVVATQIRSREKTSNGEFQFDVRVSFRGFDLRSIEERKDYISTKDFSSQWKSRLLRAKSWFLKFGVFII